MAHASAPVLTSGSAASLAYGRSVPATLVALGMTLGACLLTVAVAGSRAPLREHAHAYVGLYGVAFVAYAGAVWLVLRHPRLAAGRGLWAILGAALAYRLVLLPVPPTLSDDVFRYVWEGRVVLAGQSPYRLAPSDHALMALRARRGAN